MTIDATADLGEAVAVPAETNEALLVLQDVHKHWARNAVLEGVDLFVPRGRVVAIRGANGTGKTTLLRIAAGLIHPGSGAVSVDGLHPERDRREYLTRLGFLAAGDRGLYARLSARQHLDLCARLALMPPRERADAVERAVELFALDGYAERRVDRLSMGQRQRVGLAMTFVHSPDLVLLDEPTNSLDGEGLAVLNQYLQRVRASGGAAVWCSPDGVETPLQADSELRLAGGRLWPG